MSNYELKLEKPGENTKEQLVTVRKLLKGKDALSQLRILERADSLFKEKAGRHYGGILTEEEKNFLDPPERKN